MSSVFRTMCASPKSTKGKLDYDAADKIMQSFDKVFLIYRIGEDLPVGYTENMEIAVKLSPTFFYVQIGAYYEGLTKHELI